jgi:hypothetical protein
MKIQAYFLKFVDFSAIHASRSCGGEAYTDGNGGTIRRISGAVPRRRKGYGLTQRAALATAPEAPSHALTLSISCYRTHDE